jgi:hypothetical protein
MSSGKRRGEQERGKRVLNYRLLDEKEWGKLYPLANGLDGPIPGPTSSVVAVAEDEDGSLVGALFIQMTLHMEPLVIDPKSTGRVNFMNLIQTLMEDGEMRDTPLYAFSESALVGKMCKLVGMKQLPYRIWFKEPSPSPTEEML